MENGPHIRMVSRVLFDTTYMYSRVKHGWFYIKRNNKKTTFPLIINDTLREISDTAVILRLSCVSRKPFNLIVPFSHLILCNSIKFESSL